MRNLWKTRLIFWDPLQTFSELLIQSALKLWWFPERWHNSTNKISHFPTFLAHKRQPLFVTVEDNLWHLSKYRPLWSTPTLLPPKRLVCIRHWVTLKSFTRHLPVERVVLPKHWVNLLELLKWKQNRVVIFKYFLATVLIADDNKGRKALKTKFFLGDKILHRKPVGSFMFIFMNYSSQKLGQSFCSAFTHWAHLAFISLCRCYSMKHPLRVKKELLLKYGRGNLYIFLNWMFTTAPTSLLKTACGCTDEGCVLLS